MESDSRSEDSDDTMARGWNSDDDFFSAAGNCLSRYLCADKRRNFSVGKQSRH